MCLHCLDFSYTVELPYGWERRVDEANLIYYVEWVKTSTSCINAFRYLSHNKCCVLILLRVHLCAPTSSHTLPMGPQLSSCKPGLSVREVLFKCKVFFQSSAPTCPLSLQVTLLGVLPTSVASCISKQHCHFSSTIKSYCDVECFAGIL